MPRTAVFDCQRQWHGTDVAGDVALAVGNGCRLALHSAGQAATERLHRELQRAAQRRVPERDAVLDASRSPADHQSMAARLQRGTAAHEPQRAHTKRVCKPVQHGPKPERSLLINEYQLGWGSWPPVQRIEICHETTCAGCHSSPHLTPNPAPVSETTLDPRGPPPTQMCRGRTTGVSPDLAAHVLAMYSLRPRAQKAPPWRSFKNLILLLNLVAGAGFEPTTFRL
jgi:hypothetical protein